MPDKATKGAKRRVPVWLILLVGLIAMLLQIPKVVPLMMLGLLLIIILFALSEPETLRMIGNWKFWLTGLIIAGLSGLLLGKHTVIYFGFLPLSTDGLITGIAIVIRASILVSILMALSKRLSPDMLVRSFSKIGMPEAGGAFAIGIKLVPQMVKSWKSGFSRNKGKKITVRLAEILGSSLDIAEEINRDIDAWMQPRKEAKVFTITGSPGTGKSSLLKELLEVLEHKKVSVGGFYQPALFENNKRTGYDAVLIPNKTPLELARKSKNKDEPWNFNEETFLRAGSHLQDYQCDIRIVDEIGRMERKGEGHWPTLARKLPASGGTWVLSIRLGMVDSTLTRLGYQPESSLLLPCSEDMKKEFIEKIVESLEKDTQ